MAQNHPLKLRIRCTNSRCRAWMPDQATLPGRRPMICPSCGHPHDLNVSDELAEAHSVKTCPACAGREFFIRRDFPQKLGLALVIIFGVAASIFYFYENVLATFATLFSLVLVDAVIYFFVGRVTVCYKCRAEFRGALYNPDHQPFDLATSEKYALP